MDYFHEFVDVGYHNPYYQCRFCKVSQGSQQSSACSLAKAVLEKEAAIKEDEERREYAKMLYERKRWEYLDAKYGSK
jgi:hypothetical protein